MKPRWLLEAFGAALLLILPFVIPLLLPDGVALLHNSLALTDPILGLLIDFAGAVILGLALLAVVPRLSPFPQKLIGSLVAGLVIWWLLFAATDALTRLSYPAFLMFVRPVVAHGAQIIYALSLTIPAVFMGLGILRPDAISSIVRVMRLCLASFAFCGLWVIPKLIYLSTLQPIRSFDHSASLIQPLSRNRIVWIVFDELSQDLVFDHPVLGEKFPNLESLKSKSVSFEDVVPIGFKTEQIIPSLLAGKKIEDIRGSAKGALIYLDPAQHSWKSYETGATLFALAHDNGWNPGVSGWYNPYCRLFVSVLTACAWRPGIQDPYPLKRLGASSRKGVLQDALIVPKFFVDLLFSRPDDDRQRLLDRNIRDYQALIAEAKDLIENDKIRFIFIHLPVPHPPGFYNRQTHQLCTCGSYFDNLVLADDTLGLLEQEISRTPSARQTTLMVSSDHSWRVSLWRGNEFWTPEEESMAKRDPVDPRPVLLVHFPGQESAINIASSQPELIEHDIIASMLQNKLNTSDDLVSFLQTPQKTVLAQSQQP